MIHNISEGMYKTNGKNNTEGEKILYSHKIAENKIKLIHFQEFVQYLSFYNVKSFVMMIYRKSVDDFFLSHNTL